MGIESTTQIRFWRRIWVALLGLASWMPSAVAGASGQKTYVIDAEDRGAPVSIKDESMRSNPAGFTLKTPTFEVGPDVPDGARKSARVKKQVITRYVPQRLRFDRISVNGQPAQPRVKFSRDAEIFQGGRIRDESMKADFYGKVVSDLNP